MNIKILGPHIYYYKGYCFLACDAVPSGVYDTDISEEIAASIM